MDGLEAQGSDEEEKEEERAKGGEWDQEEAHADRMSVYMVLPPYMSLAGFSHRESRRVVGLIWARWNFLTQKGSWRKFFWITRMLSRQR